MADIELVIKIPEEIIEYIKKNGCLSVIYNDEVAKAIKNGTPLPKGHGDLVDLEELIHEFWFCPLIEADKEDEDAVIEADKEEGE